MESITNQNGFRRGVLLIALLWGALNAMADAVPNAVTGTALNPDGTPASGATVVLVRGNVWRNVPWFAVNSEGNPDPKGEGITVAQTDRDGRFEFQNPLRPNKVLVFADAGNGWSPTSSLATNSTIRLEPWISSKEDRSHLSLESLVAVLAANFDLVGEWLSSFSAEPQIPEKYRVRVRLDSPPGPHVQARQELIKRGTNAWNAIPLLVDNLFKTNLQDRTAEYESVNVLVGLHVDDTPYWPMMKQKLANRGEPVDAFGYFLTHIFEWPTDRVDPKLQRFSLRALAAIGPPAGSSNKMALPGMFNLIHSDSEELRRLAWEALGALGPGGSNAVPALEKMLNDPLEYPNVRVPAGVALAKIQPANTNVLHVFREGLRDERTVMQVYSAAGLNQLGVAPGEYFPVLTNALSHRLVTVRCVALDTLRKLGAQAQSARPLVQNMTNDEDEKVRGAAVKALKEL